MIKKFTTFLLAFAIVLSISTPKSSAAGGAIGTVVGNVAISTLGAVVTELVLRAAHNGLDNYFSKPQTKEFAENLIAEGIFSLADYIAAGYTDQDIYDQFTNYNAQLETDLGTTYVSDSAVYFPVAVERLWNGYADNYLPEWTGSISGNSFTISGYFYGSRNYINVCRYSALLAPLSGFYKFHFSFSSDIVYSPSLGYPAQTRTYYSAGSEIIKEKTSGYGTNLQLTGYNSESRGTISGSLWYLIEPDNFSFSDRLPALSRPTSLVTPIAIQNPDQTYTVYNNITLVDEGNKVVFDPTTGESITFTDWVYDYDSRTYDLTLDGGGSMTVQFGDDSITMTQGDTVTNIYYVQDPADDPGTDNPDDPDNPGTDADVSGFFAWWKNAWNGFVDRLFTVLDGGDLEVILPGEEGNPEDEEDDGWTVFDLFALIRDALWKIITGVITVVLDGFLGLVDAIASLGDFFDIYDPANPNGIFGVPDGGGDLWS